MDVEASVREFLNDQVAVRHDSDPVAPGESLLDSGLLDSASILELVTFLEKRFDFVISDEQLVPENFETIDAIVALVGSRGDAPAAGGDVAS